MKRKRWMLLLVLSAALMVAVPMSAFAETEMEADGINVVIAVDTSKSMMDIPFDSSDMNIVRSTLLLYDLLTEIPGAAVKYSLFSSSVEDSQQIKSFSNPDDLGLTDDGFNRLDEPDVMIKRYSIENYDTEAKRFTALAPGLEEVHDFIIADRHGDTEKDYAVVLITDFQTDEPAKRDAVGYAAYLHEIGVPIYVISPQGIEQKRDGRFINLFISDAGITNIKYADDEQELLKAYVETFIQLASCYAHYQPVFTALTFPPIKTPKN